MPDVRRVSPQWPGATKDNPSGVPQPCRIAIVGEAPGQDEEWLGVPFVGMSGMELTSMLEAAGIDRNTCLLTNVVSERPPENNFAAFCLRKDELPPGYPLGLGPIISDSTGNYYLHPDRFHEGARLRAELATAAPNVVLALGAKAAWALLGTPEIGRVRGVVHRSITSVPYKVVPTWHPAAVMRQYRMRPVAIVDMVKARVESETAAIRYDNAELWLAPTLDDLYEFERRHMARSSLDSVDIETARGEITVVGVAPDPAHALVVPFRTLATSYKRPITRNGRATTETVYAYTGNYWPSAYEEKQAWLWLKRVAENAKRNIVGQNFMYDLQHLTRYGMRVRGFNEDTMLMHHARYPELPKNLGFLGSVYTNHPSWKYLSGRHAQEEKRDA